MLFDFTALSGADTYKLLCATIVPRPIAWITSMDGEGRMNAAPFSFFNVLSGDPPVIAVGIGTRSPGVDKDTMQNLAVSGEFVVNLVSHALAEQMNVTAADFPPGVDELAEAGLHAAPSVKVKPARIAESPAALECQVLQNITLGPDRVVTLGSVLALHVRDDAVLNPARCHIDTPVLDLIGRLHGAGWYSRITDRFHMPRIKPGQHKRGI